MIDYILAALTIGVVSFAVFFIISFATLSLVAGIVHVLGSLRPTPLAESVSAGIEMPA